MLDEEELDRAAAFLHEEDQLTYVLAHVALRQLLGAATGRRPQSLRMVREPCPNCDGPHGRPSLDDRSLHFSLSHSGSLVLLALSSTPVGVDIEHLPGPRTVADVGRILHPRETAELQALDGPASALAFARAWTRKEAHLKGRGTGLSGDLSRDYLGTGAHPVRALEGWRITDITAPDGFAAALAVAGPAAVPSTPSSASAVTSTSVSPLSRAPSSSRPSREQVTPGRGGP